MTASRHSSIAVKSQRKSHNVVMAFFEPKEFVNRTMKNFLKMD